MYIYELLYEWILPSNISSLAIFRVKGGPTFPNAGRYFRVREYKNLQLSNEKDP